MLLVSLNGCVIPKVVVDDDAFLLLLDYKPVFATIPKAHDDSRSSRSSGSDQYRDFRSPSQPSSYDRYYDTSSYNSFQVPPRREGITCVISAQLSLVISIHWVAWWRNS